MPFVRPPVCPMPVAQTAPFSLGWKSNPLVSLAGCTANGSDRNGHKRISGAKVPERGLDKFHERPSDAYGIHYNLLAAGAPLGVSECVGLYSA